MGSSSGIVATYMWEVGVAVGCGGALIGVLDYFLKWSQLSEKYATLRNKFASLSVEYDEESYQENMLLLQSAILEQDLM